MCRTPTTTTPTKTYYSNSPHSHLQLRQIIVVNLGSLAGLKFYSSRTVSLWFGLFEDTHYYYVIQTRQCRGRKHVEIQIGYVKPAILSKIVLASHSSYHTELLLHELKTNLNQISMEGQGSGKISSSSSSDDANTIRNASIKTTSKTVATASTTPTTTTMMVTMVGPVTGNTKWDMMYHNLMEYKRKHNNCLVPNRYKQMPQLGSWVSTQRRHYKLKQAGKDTPLTQLRLDLLNRVGFVWATKDPRHVSL